MMDIDLTGRSRGRLTTHPPSLSQGGSPPPAPRAHAAPSDFAAVLLAAQGGADWAMTVLFRRFNPPLVAYLRAADPNACEDVAADVWVSVSAALTRFQGTEARFRGWLFTIARNRLIDARRRAARRLIAVLSDEELAGCQVTSDPGDDLTERLSAERAVNQLVSALPEPQSRVVLLRVIGGLDVADVARIMGRSPGWVRVTQHRALLRLAESNKDLRAKRPDGPDGR
jgi:RNA polymerase sigma-70 factor (ECF subfamily)